MDEDNENLTYDFTFLKLEGKNPLNDRRIISGQFGYISDEDWIENYGKLSLGHEDYCNEEFEFALEDEFVWDFQFLNLECKVDILYESSLPFIRNPPMKKGLSKDGKNMDESVETALELSIMKPRRMQVVFDHGKYHLKFSTNFGRIYE